MLAWWMACGRMASELHIVRQWPGCRSTFWDAVRDVAKWQVNSNCVAAVRVPLEFSGRSESENTLIWWAGFGQIGFGLNVTMQDDFVKDLRS